MKYTIRKGLESPCKIWGFLSSDYWILVAIIAAIIILFVLGLRSGIMNGDWNLSIIAFIGAITIIPIMVTKFKKNVRNRKFDEIKREFTISNFQLNHTIRINENKRSI